MFKLPQLSPGNWLGGYYTQLQYTSSYMVFVNFAMIATSFWVIVKPYIERYTPWLSFPLFVGVSLVLLFVVIPLLDYIFMQKSRIAYYNEQVCRHDNPVMDRLDKLEKQTQKLEKMIKGIKNK